ncbi:MAG TPA: histidine phosphatase family protein [Rubrobacteraceae bacterium]|nr:histidine phosphatase family protein [Rubrobacteraceae bacterium]
MDLYLVRHAVAYERDSERWPDDAERPLTPRGEEDFREAARGVEQIVPEVRALLSSPYSRAWRTAEILAELEGWPEPKSFPALEPEVPPEKVALALQTYSEAESVVLVGHRPGLHELAVYLLTGDAGGADIKIKKGGAIRITFDGAPQPGAGRLHWLLTPKVLRALRRTVT